MWWNKISSTTFDLTGPNITLYLFQGGKYYNKTFYSPLNKQYRIFVPKRRNIMRIPQEQVLDGTNICVHLLSLP